MPIRRLPPLLVNQIAAGEVIERPASVVKELLENAIDAGATRIDVAIEQGGKELVRVSDDGAGIPAEELPLALAAHATSKIETADDLDMIATMGFRGEALASIASVSRISMVSRPPNEESACRIDGAGERLDAPRPEAGPKGTTVTVKNLFFNTPARRKFLKTDQTETGRVTEAVQAVALANPGLAVRLRADDRVKLDLPPHDTPARRALAVLGEELADELLEVDAEAGGIRVCGLAGTPAIARATARHQRVYVNGRPIVDRSIAHAVKEAYRGLIEPTRSPTIVLFLEMDPGSVDVNVHPAKSEVRFRNPSQVHRVVMSAVKASLRAADLTPAFDLDRSASELGSGLEPSVTGLTASVRDAPAAGSEPGAFVEYFRRLDPRQKGFVYGEVKQALRQTAPELLEREIRREHELPDAELPSIRPVTDVLQVHSSYIVTEDADGLLIIDQHALHERVMFEKLRERVDVGSLEAQRLLMPAIVQVDRGQMEAVETLGSLLARLGIEAEPMGPTTVAVHAFTSLLFERKVDPVTFMQELLGRAVTGGLGNDPEAALSEVLDMMACKAAIKAGDRLEPSEMEELLANRERIERSSNCPHGRPTSLRLSLRDLERQFGRR